MTRGTSHSCPGAVHTRRRLLGRASGGSGTRPGRGRWRTVLTDNRATSFRRGRSGYRSSCELLKCDGCERCDRQRLPRRHLLELCACRGVTFVETLLAPVRCVADATAIERGVRGGGEVGTNREVRRVVPDDVASAVRVDDGFSSGE